MSFSANCISCHMCQNICFWIVHFCWEFLSEFPKQWYLLRHLFISVQFMRLGEPTLCVFLQFCTSSLYSYSFVDFLREHHALCIPAMWTSVYLCWHSLKFVHVTRLAERHRWPPSRGWEGLKSVVAISNSSSSSHCWGEQGNFQIRFFICDKKSFKYISCQTIGSASAASFFAAFTLTPPPPPPSTSWLVRPSLLSGQAGMTNGDGNDQRGKSSDGQTGLLAGLPKSGKRSNL